MVWGHSGWGGVEGGPQATAGSWTDGDSHLQLVCTHSAITVGLLSLFVHSLVQVAEGMASVGKFSLALLYT